MSSDSIAAGRSVGASVKSGNSPKFKNFSDRLRALDNRARNLSGCDLVGAYLRGESVRSAGRSFGGRDPAAWGDLVCRVCAGGGQLREVVRLVSPGAVELADFVRVVDCFGCAGSGLDSGLAVAAGRDGAEAVLASLEGWA